MRSYSNSMSNRAIYYFVFVIQNCGKTIRRQNEQVAHQKHMQSSTLSW